MPGQHRAYQVWVVTSTDEYPVSPMELSYGVALIVTGRLQEVAEEILQIRSQLIGLAEDQLEKPTYQVRSV